MKVENLEQAKKLVKELETVKSDLDLVVEERNRIIRTKDKYSYLKVQINGYTVPIVQIETAHGILELLIAEYSLKAESLTKQIEAL